MVYKWTGLSKRNLGDDLREGRPKTASRQDINFIKIKNMVLEYRRLIERFSRSPRHFIGHSEQYFM